MAGGSLAKSAADGFAEGKSACSNGDKNEWNL
jgi:hypothetical protein